MPIRGLTATPGAAGSIDIVVGEIFGGGSGNMVLNGNLTAVGGDGFDGADGGSGGTVTIGSYDGNATILAGADIDSSGGDGSGGGTAGGIIISAGYLETGSGSVTLGASLTASGGEGTSFGDDGGLIGIYSYGGGISLQAAAVILAGGEGGSVSVSAGSGSGSYDVLMDADATITASQGLIDIEATGDVVLGQLSVGSADGGDSNSVYVGAEGSIRSANSGNITNISIADGGYVELRADSGIGSDDEGYENVITLAADGGAGELELDARTYDGDITIDVSGSLYISNDSVEINSFYASTDDNITLNVSGDIGLGDVYNYGYGDVTLAAGGEGGNISAYGNVTLSGVGIGDDEDAINIYGGDGGSALCLTALGGAGGEGGEIAVNASDSGFDSLTITLEDADSDVDVSLNNSDYVVLSADGADVTLDDVRTIGSGIDVTINAEASDLVLGGEGGTVVEANGNNLTLNASGAISNANGGVIVFGSSGGSLVMSAGDGIGEDGAVQVYGGAGSVAIAAEAEDDILIDSSGGMGLTVGEIGDVYGISSASGDVTLAADDLTIDAAVSGGRVTLTTSDTDRSIDLGGEGGDSALSLTQYELGYVTSDVIQIGDEDNDGGIYVTDAVNFAYADHEVAHLVTGSGDIANDGTGSALQVDSLAITTSGTVALYGDNEIGTLAVDHVGGGEGSVSVTDLDGLLIGTVDDVDGVSAYDVTLTTGGTLTDDGVNQITAETLTLDAATGIDVNIDAASVAAFNSISGGISLTATNEDGVLITAEDTAAGTISLVSAGAVTLDSVTNLGGDVVIDAEGAVVNVEDNAGAVVTAESLTITGASSIGAIDDALSIDVTATDVTVAGNILLEAVGADGVTIAAAVVEADGGIVISSASETVILDGVTTENGGILVAVDAGIDAKDVSAGSADEGDGDVLLSSEGNITVGEVSAEGDNIAIGAGGDIIDGVGDTATAASVGLSATGDIGSAVAALSVSADLLTAVAGGDIFLNEADDIEITELAAYGDITVAAATLTLSEVTVFAEGSVTFDAEVNIAGDVIVATDEFDGDISFNGGGSSASDEATLTLVAGAGDILFDGGDFASEENPLGQLNVISATDFTIESPFDVFTLDIGSFDVSGTVDLGDTLVVLGENAFTINATDIFGGLTAPNAESVTILATGVIGELADEGDNPIVENDNPFVANTTGPLNFNSTGGVIDGVFGGGGVQGFAWLGALDGTTFVINGVTVVFAPLGGVVDVESVVNSIAIETADLEAEIDSSGPLALQSTSIFVADIFSVDFSLGTNLAVAPAAGGDGGEEGGDDGGGDFLGNFWGELIESAPEEEAEEGDDNFVDDNIFADEEEDEEDIFGDNEDEENDIFGDNEDEEQELQQEQVSNLE